MTETPPRAVTIVTQTRILAGHDDEFAAWQASTSGIVAAFPGFIEQSIKPPLPPAQADWVILQRFDSAESAVNWLKSPERLARIAAIQKVLVGADDIHLVRDGEGGALPAPVSMVIATRLKPGQEAAYREWEQRIAVAQSRAEGFRGYRLEPPIPGVQEDWLAILRFDSQDHLDAWFNSAERRALLDETHPFIERTHGRLVHTGFDQWFAGSANEKPAPWKQNMIVLLMLYPVVFLFGHFVLPILTGAYGWPFAVAVFTGNVVSVALLSQLVPRAAARFGWWLRSRELEANLRGAGLLLGIYAATVLLFTWL